MILRHSQGTGAVTAKATSCRCLTEDLREPRTTGTRVRCRRHRGLDPSRRRAVGCPCGDFSKPMDIGDCDDDTGVLGEVARSKRSAAISASWSDASEGIGQEVLRGWLMVSSTRPEKPTPGDAACTLGGRRTAQESLKSPSVMSLVVVSPPRRRPTQPSFSSLAAIDDGFRPKGAVAISPREAQNSAKGARCALQTLRPGGAPGSGQGDLRMGMIDKPANLRRERFGSGVASWAGRLRHRDSMCRARPLNQGFGDMPTGPGNSRCPARFVLRADATRVVASARDRLGSRVRMTPASGEEDRRTGQEQQCADLEDSGRTGTGVRQA